MSLQGSLETFSIPDVLVLLASTKKTGELRVVGGQVDGRLWFETGEIVQTTVGGRAVDTVNGVFEILRLVEGTFSFNTDVKAPKAGAGQVVELVLHDAQARLSEWHDIAKVVPHLDCALRLADTLPSNEVTVGRPEWEIMVHVAGGASVRQLMEVTKLAEFDACRAARELIDRGLLGIDSSVKPRSARTEPSKGVSVPVEEAVLENARTSAPTATKTNGDANGAGKHDAGVSAEKKPTPEPEPEAKPEAKPATKSEDDAPKVRATTSTDAPTGAGRVSATKSSPAAAVAALLDDVNGSDEKAKSAKSEPKPETSEEGDPNALVAQLAALGVDEDDQEMKARVAEHLAKGGELPQPEGDEPINRGLLLKFLSSVRN